MRAAKQAHEKHIVRAASSGCGTRQSPRLLGRGLGLQHSVVGGAGAHGTRLQHVQQHLRVLLRPQQEVM